jgi:hypothetical protein
MGQALLGYWLLIGTWQIEQLNGLGMWMWISYRAQHCSLAGRLASSTYHRA